MKDFDTARSPAAWSSEAVLGERVKVLRQRRGWTQDELATHMRALGFSWRQSTAAKTEVADRPVRLNEAVALASLFEVALDELVKPDLHPLVARLHKDLGYLANLERAVETAAESVQSAQESYERSVGLLTMERRRTEVLENLISYTINHDDGPVADDELHPVLAAFVRTNFSPTNEQWKDILEEAGFDRSVLDASAEARLGGAEHAVSEDETPAESGPRLIASAIIAQLPAPEPKGEA